MKVCEQSPRLPVQVQIGETQAEKGKVLKQVRDTPAGKGLVDLTYSEDQPRAGRTILPYEADRDTIKLHMFGHAAPPATNARSRRALKAAAGSLKYFHGASLAKLPNVRK